MTDELKQILSELKSQLTTLYGERLEKLVLFGSQARGDAEPDSDIDVLVVLKGEVDDDLEIERTGSIMSQLSLRHSLVLSGVWVSVQEYESRRMPLVQAAHREGVSI
jgi:uncharacterized protein